MRSIETVNTCCCVWTLFIFFHFHTLFLIPCLCACSFLLLSLWVFTVTVYHWAAQLLVPDFMLPVPTDVLWLQVLVNSMYRSSCELACVYWCLWPPTLQLVSSVQHNTCLRNCTVERRLAVEFCSQPHYCNRPYCPTARFRLNTVHMASDKLLQDSFKITIVIK